uniref:Uncharacterized protein n=1 Tax=Knipowitschia caucasica TaxID=637954 RepID=A0AAV2M5A1_KNICA
MVRRDGSVFWCPVRVCWLSRGGDSGGGAAECVRFGVSGLCWGGGMWRGCPFRGGCEARWVGALPARPCIVGGTQRAAVGWGGGASLWRGGGGGVGGGRRGPPGGAAPWCGVAGGWASDAAG